MRTSEIFQEMANASPSNGTLQVGVKFIGNRNSQFFHGLRILYVNWRPGNPAVHDPLAVHDLPGQIPRAKLYVP